MQEWHLRAHWSSEVVCVDKLHDIGRGNCPRRGGSNAGCTGEVVGIAYHEQADWRRGERFSEAIGCQ